MIKRASTAVAAALIGWAAVSTGMATAATPQTAAPAAHASHPRQAATVCTVNDNGVNFRGGPGTNYPVLGTVNRGQKLNFRGVEGNWVMGDLWGGNTGVWIHTAYLDGC
ncbi:SH3 domain-containing protein [Streptomyces sp. NPDC046203]|uniref:SH3 domain-containing protein n=1 Tax=Streptomyces sp. NPDC046203 TaxID=3154602 RepID=UPI003408B065